MKYIVDDRMIIETIDAAIRPVRVAPVNAFEEPHPLRPVAQFDGKCGRLEHQQARVEHAR
jgi:hypothetical protein